MYCVPSLTKTQDRVNTMDIDHDDREECTNAGVRCDQTFVEQVQDGPPGPASLHDPKGGPDSTDRHGRGLTRRGRQLIRAKVLGAETFTEVYVKQELLRPKTAVKLRMHLAKRPHRRARLSWVVDVSIRILPSYWTNITILERRACPAVSISVVCPRRSTEL